MKLAVMQPYFFPYLGYFQLIKEVDKFVILDDVQYVRRGWINKNRILLGNKPFKIGLPVKKDSREKNINKRYLTKDSEIFRNKLLVQLQHAYKRAPFFDQVFPVIARVISYKEMNLSIFNTLGLKELCKFLNITTPFYLSSEIRKEENFTGEDRMVNINEIMGSETYINPVGGIELYKRDSFLKKGIELKFLVTEPYSYQQFNKEFIKDLSIIDILMFNSAESTNSLLSKYQLE